MTAIIQDAHSNFPLKTLTKGNYASTESGGQILLADQTIDLKPLVIAAIATHASILAVLHKLEYQAD